MSQAARTRASEDQEWTAVEPSTGAVSAAATSGAEREPVTPEERWARLVYAVGQVRKLQRYWANIGRRLQDFPQPLRDRVAKTYPTLQ